MPKRAITLTPGRRLRWTIEVTTDDGAPPVPGEATTTRRTRSRTRTTAAAPPVAAPAVTQVVAPSDEPTVSMALEPTMAAEPTMAVEPTIATMAEPLVEPSVQLTAPSTAETTLQPAPAPAARPAATSVPIRRRAKDVRAVAALAAVAALIVVAAVAVPRRPTTLSSAPVGQTASRQLSVPSIDSNPRTLEAPLGNVAGAALAGGTPEGAMSGGRASYGGASLPLRAGGDAPAKGTSTRPSTGRAARSTTAAPSPAAPVPAPPEESAVRDNAVTTLVVPEPLAGAPAPAPAADSADVTSPVTITGCLEVSVDHDAFRLTDADGAAPKARSWRSGFLRKRSSAVALVGRLDQRTMASYVGKRVAAAGQLDGRSLAVESVRVVSDSCD